MRALLDELAERMQAHAKPGQVIDRIRAHDFRRTLKSHLARLKVSKEHRHAVAGHAESGIDKHYLMYEFMAEKAEALAKWENELRRIATKAGVVDKVGIPLVEESALPIAA